MVARRLDRVSDCCRDVLCVASLLGREFSGDLVAAVTGHGTDAVVSGLDEAAGLGLVRPLAPQEADGTSLGYPADFAFLHDLVREAIAARINPLERRALHARIASALEATPGSADDLGRLAALVHHLRLGRQSAAAARYATRLGDAAMRAHAHAEAARAYRIATELAPSAVGITDLPTPAELFVRLGDAALAAGDAGAVDAFITAETHYAAAGDRHGVARVRRRLGTVHARREEFDLAVAYLEAALELLTELEQESGPADWRAEAEMAEVLVELGSIRGLSLGHYVQVVALGR